MLEYPKQLQLSELTDVSATVTIPGSKSITNRAYVIAALATGVTQLYNPLHSDDTNAMSGCLSKLGVTIDDSVPFATSIIGKSGKFHTPSETLFVRNSGTTIRFLTSAAALIKSDATVVLDGVPRMRQRPIQDLVEAMQQLGIDAKASQNGCPPVTVSGANGIPGGTSLIKGSISSQFLSGLLMSAPYAQSPVRLLVDGELISKPYVDMTIAMMRSFGVSVIQNGYASFEIPPNQQYSGRSYAIEPDASNASYFLAAAAVTGGQVVVNGLGTSSIQGDIALIDVLELMGCTIQKSENSLEVHGPDQLNGIDFDASAIPDMAQTIAVVAAFATGTTRLTGIGSLRIKETDRIHAVAVELRKIGASVIEGDDYLIITPGPVKSLAEIDTYDDHRMAMSFAVAGLRVSGLRINDPGCVAKTFPDFWVRWNKAFPGTVSTQD